MNKFLYIILSLLLLSFVVISCKKNDSISETTATNVITISSSASDNASEVFGNGYQYQFNTSETYLGAITNTLSNQPDGMTIPSSGHVEWTPSKPSDIKTHTKITITKDSFKKV